MAASYEATKSVKVGEPAATVMSLTMKLSLTVKGIPSKCLGGSPLAR